MTGWMMDGFTGSFISSRHPLLYTSLNPVPNAQVCVHITKLQLQTTFLVKLIELCIKIWRFFLKPNSIMAIEIFI
jgi:hypothetical protein